MFVFRMFKGVGRELCKCAQILREKNLKSNKEHLLF